MSSAAKKKTYEELQHEESSWSHNSEWGANAMDNAYHYMQILKTFGWFYADDVWCDFGGNDGTVAAAWQKWTRQPSLCVDMDAIKQRKGVELYGPRVAFLESRLEDLSLMASDSVDWGFASHTLEHVEDLAQAVSEIWRVTRRGLYVVVPIEEDTSVNPSHMRASKDVWTWMKWLRHPGTDVLLWWKPTYKQEFHIMLVKTGHDA